jgi:hypothetical protein
MEKVIFRILGENLRERREIKAKKQVKPFRRWF